MIFWEIADFLLLWDRCCILTSSGWVSTCSVSGSRCFMVVCSHVIILWIGIIISFCYSRFIVDFLLLIYTCMYHFDLKRRPLKVTINVSHLISCPKTSPIHSYRWLIHLELAKDRWNFILDSAISCLPSLIL